MEKIRCPWCLKSDQYITYHDEEWGIPVHDDKVHFEFLILEGAQAGLSWFTILNKREGYRKAFADFDVKKVSGFSQDKVELLMANSGIVRNKLKILSTVNNAKKFIEVQKEYGSFDNYIWGFVDHKPIVNKWKKMENIPATSPVSDALSKDLKKRGFKFVGSTVMYAYLQACGLINDHLVDCWKYDIVN